MAVRRLFDNVKIDKDKENEKDSESNFKRIVEVDVHTLNYYLHVIEFGIWSSLLFVLLEILFHYLDKEVDA